MHPATIAISLPVQKHIEVPKITADCKECLEIRQKLSQLGSCSTPKEASALLDELQNHPLIDSLKKDVQMHEKALTATTPTVVREHLDILRALDKQISKAFEETRLKIKGLNPEHRLEPLLHIKILERLLLGAPASTSLSEYSLIDADSLSRSISILNDYQQKLTAPAHCIDLLLDGLEGGTEAFALWNNFLLQLEPLIETKAISLEELKQFKQLVTTLRQTGALPLWLTFFFNKNPSDTSWSSWLSSFFKNPFQKQFQSLIKEIGHPEQQMFESLLKQQSSIVQLRQQISRFADPKTFDPAWADLQKLLDVDYLKDLKNAPAIVKANAYKTLEASVELFDTAIKTMKASQAFPNDIAKTVLFKKMLFPCFKLMQRAVEAIPTEVISDNFPNWGYKNPIKSIKSQLDKLSDRDAGQLQPSNGFSVAAAMLGSVKDGIHIQPPTTLEDVFTLIHQNSLVCISTLNRDLVGNEMTASLLPSPVKDVIKQISDTNWGKKVQQVGLEVRRQEVVLRYNVPLRQHSSRFEIHYDKISKKMTVKTQFLGNGEEDNRWQFIKAWGQMLHQAKVLTLDRPITIGENEAALSWVVTPENIARTLREYIAMGAYTLPWHAAKRTAMDGVANRWKGEPEIDAIFNPSTLLHWMTSGNPDREVLALAILQSLVLKGQGIQEGVKAAEQAKASKIGDIRYQGIVLTKAIEFMARREEAIKAAELAMTKDDRLLHERLNALFKALVEKEEGIQDALSAAQHGMASGNLCLQRISLDIFQAIVERDGGFQEAIGAAKKGMEASDYTGLPEKSLDLLIALVKKGQGIETAWNVKMFSNIENEYLHNKLLELQSVLRANV